MSMALWKKSISESAVLLTSLAIGVALFSWFRVHVVGEVDTTSFQKILSLLPKEWLKYTSVDVEWMISYVGRTAMTLDEPFMVMLIAIWAIVRGSDVVSGEISRGTMEMLLAQPISRGRLYLIQTLVTLGGVVVLSLVAWLSMWIAVHTTNVTIGTQPTGFWDSVTGVLGNGQEGAEKPEPIFEPMADYVDSRLFLPGILNLGLFGFFVAGMATVLSSFDRYRWRTLGVAVAVYLGSAMIKILAMTSDSLAWSKWLTFFSLYEPEIAVKLVQEDPASIWMWARYDGENNWLGYGPMGHNVSLVVGAIICLVAGNLIFRRRDIPAPL